MPQNNKEWKNPPIYLLGLTHPDKPQPETPWFIKTEIKEAKKNLDGSYRKNPATTKAVMLLLEQYDLIDPAHSKAQKFLEEPERWIKDILSSEGYGISDLGKDGLVCYDYPNILSYEEDNKYTFQSTKGKYFKVIRMNHWGEKTPEQDWCEEGIQQFCFIPDGIYLIPVERYKETGEEEHLEGEEIYIYPDWECKHELVPSWTSDSYNFEWVHHETMIESLGLEEI